MKKIFTLFAGLLMTVALFAADRRPTITVSSDKNYKIVIDGKAYFGSYINIRPEDFCGNRFDGRHSIQVFEMRRGFWNSRERMVASSSFFLSNRDILIKIDWFGNIRFREMGGHRRYDRYDDYDRRDRDFDRRDNDQRDRDFDRRDNDQRDRNYDRRDNDQRGPDRNDNQGRRF